LEDFTSLNIDSLQFKENVKWKIRHPLSGFKEEVEVNLVFCTFLDGKVPHGIAPFSYSHSLKIFSFTGVGVFNNGELDGGPAVFLTGVKKVLSFANMTAGVASGWGSQHFAEDTTMYANTLKTKVDATGMIYYVGQWFGARY
jgi:hypothetical protein